MPRFPHWRIYRSNYPSRVARLSKRVWMVANSQFTADRLVAAGVPKQRVVIKYLGVPVAEAPPPPRPDRSEATVLYLGRLVDVKGPEQTIQAFEIASKQGLNAKLIIAGDGPLRPNCERIRQQSPFANRIELLGSVNADYGARLRQQADIFTAHNGQGTVTNQEEAYGVSFVEAAADALPVVTGRSGGICETVVHDKTGLLFEPGDVEGHAAALLLLLAKDPSLRREYGLAGYHRAKELFSIDCERQRWNEIFSIVGCCPPVANTPS